MFCRYMTAQVLKLVAETNEQAGVWRCASLDQYDRTACWHQSQECWL